MILGLFRRSSNDAVIERLYAAVVSASRAAPLYADLAVPDTFEGRFESLTLHAVLVLRRLQALPAPGPEMAQHLIDIVFKHLDRTLREMGVGDTAVPKRMKGLAEAFLGRSTAYEEAIRSGRDALAVALARNVLARKADSTIVDGGRLAHYVEACIALLATEPLQHFIDGRVAFVDPAANSATLEVMP